jgi:integrase
MSDHAHIYTFPGVAEAPGDRPATYAEYLVSIGRAAHTVRAYVYRLARAEADLAELGATVLSANAFQLSAMSEATPNTHAFRGQLRCALKHYYEWQDRNDAPLRAVRVPPSPRMVCQALEPDDARKLVDTARGWWPHGAMVLLGLYLALRREEIACAEWDRFDDNLEWYTVFGKNSKTATIPVHPVVREEFAPHRGTGFIFPGRTGIRDHVNPATVWDWTSQVAEAAGLGHVRTHQLRHTSLTTALDNTSDLRSVMEFARHERPQTTAGYTRTTKEQLRAVMEALEY